jgi:hypothetical protein
MARQPVPSRAGRGRPGLQTQRVLMPCAQYEDLEQRRQAWRDRGVDADESTARDEDEDNDDPYPQEDADPSRLGSAQPQLTC